MDGACPASGSSLGSPPHSKLSLNPVVQQRSSGPAATLEEARPSADPCHVWHRGGSSSQLKNSQQKEKKNEEKFPRNAATTLKSDQRPRANRRPLKGPALDKNLNLLWAAKGGSCLTLLQPNGCLPPPPEVFLLGAGGACAGDHNHAGSVEVPCFEDFHGT